MNAQMNMTRDGNGRIVSNPAVCHGNPVIRGTRIMVWLILEYLANGDSVDDVLAAYPSITREDVSACLAHASRIAKERVIPMETQTAAYPPAAYQGIIVLRHPRPTLKGMLALMEQVATLLRRESPRGRLWIVEPGRVRIHE